MERMMYSLTKARGRRPTALTRAVPIILLIMLSSLSLSLVPLVDLAGAPVPRAEAAGQLEVKILAGYNLVVDSNATSPSTYAPSVATVGGRFCNTGDAPLTNVTGYIGNYAAGTPGVYPARDSSTFDPSHPLYNTGVYYFTHVGGSLGTADATRFIGTLSPGECQVQYWHLKYPQCSEADRTPPCSGIPVWGDSVKPDDDLWLTFDIWGTSAEGSGANATQKMTMRNEISAMANKIKPNPDGQWFNTKSNVIEPGGLITSNGILYEIGVINQGFDNDGNGTPDYNAWLQPVGDASYDPGCFRLVRTSGLFTITRSAGNSDMVIPFSDAYPSDPMYVGGLYFTNLPPDNTGTRGLVYYTFMALNGPCSTALSPYQEVASGRDNEKFNGDYGTGIPPIGSTAPKVTIDKASNPNVIPVPLPGSTTYTIYFDNNGSTAAGLGLSSGFSPIPLVISDTVPNGMQYVGGSATYNLTYSPNTGVTIRYSTNSGTTWSTTDPGTTLSTWPGSKVIIQWWLNDPLPAGSTGSYARFQATVPSGYSGPPFIENCADSRFDTAAPFARDCSTIMIQGTGSIGDFVWKDLDGDGLQDGGAETGIGNILLTLYYDQDGDGLLDATDPAVDTRTTLSYNVIDGYIDISGNGTIGAEDDASSVQGVAVIDGGLDINGDGSITAADDGTFCGYNVYDGRIDIDNSGTVTSADDGSLLGRYQFNKLPAGKYIVQVDIYDTDLPTGYTPTTPTTYAVTLSAGGTNWNADFGFGPTLRMDKHLDSLNPAYVGEEVTFHIDLYNTLPGDGTADGFCTYSIWATIAHPNSSYNPPGGGPANAQWSNPSYALNAPDGLMAVTVMQDNTDLLGLSGFNLGSPGGTITSVRYDIYAREIKNFASTDNFYVRVWYNDSQLGSTYQYNGATYFTGGAGTDYLISQNITGLRSWTWSDFLNNMTEMQLEGNKGAGSTGDIGVDAVRYVITTDRLCGSADTTIAVLPLEDTYDADLLQFLYADPPVSSATTSGSAPNTVGTLTWDNLGPLYAGGVRSVEVTFRALATVASPGTTDTAAVTEAKFANGRDVNDDDDDAQVTINASGSIAGTVWADGGTTSGWVNPNGYDSSDTFIPNVKVELYGCYSLITGRLLTSGEATTNKECTNAANNGEWRLIETQYTDGSGNYAFTGLRDGYYNVEINDGNTPTGFPTRRAEPNPAGNGSGFTCGTCDGLWNTWTANLNTFNYVDNTTGGENINRVNFGYINAYLGAVAGYVWHDLDADGVWDEGEQPISGVRVDLTCTGTGCPPSTYVTTDANGYYQFTGLPVANATYQVVVTPPSGMSQSGDPDVPGSPCGGSCDNTKSSFTLTAGQVTGPYNFGYTGGLDIGDTVYVDWNGDGDQDSGEEGIPDVVVYLYRDVNEDGDVDPDIDILIGSETTDASGYYEFTDLPGNNTRYIVVVGTSTLPSGYTQTGDPDESGMCTVCDSQDPLTLSTSDYLDADFGYRPRGYASIGDYVWLDSDGDGIQDVSEAGINGVTVNLYQDQDGDGVIDAEDALVATTQTGFSVIDGYIDIDRDGNVSDAGDDSPALLGVRVIDGKLDINGDGVVNTSDDGTFAGYPVIDGRIDIDNSGTITTADDGTLNGLYQFRDLPAGNYIVEIPSSNFGSGQPLNGLTQSYDQDSTTVLNNQDAVSLGSAENYVLGDFGYTSSAIGDTVWQDNNGNGLLDAGEPGIPNVVVELYQDLNNDGDVDDPGETTPIRTTNTDASGHYYFTGLPGGDYVVKIAASNFNSGGPLYQFTQTYDPDASTQPCSGGECDNQGKLVDTSSAYGLPLGQVDYSRDFGYRPLGRIGDTLWIDTDNDGIRDANESGISNITVYLCTSSPCDDTNDIAQISTDSNGYYTFGNLPDGTYYVGVNTADTDFPSGLTQTYDPDGTLDNQGSSIVISGGVVTSIGGNPCSNCDMNVDFGYRFSSGTNSLSGTVYHDNNNNATLDGGETVRYPNVTVNLWRNGLLFATTTSDSNGFYQFTNLPDGTYTVAVDVTDPDLKGAVPTATSSPTTSYTRTLSGGTSSTGNDFGFLFSYDFGDLPANYNNTVLETDNGARHFVPFDTSQRTYLGASIDTEPDGQESTYADGDGADEDGVQRKDLMTWAPGSGGGSITVTVSGCPVTCYLSGWIDWTRDGDLADAGERILTGYPVRNGVQNIIFDIPAGTSFDNVSYYARFRLYTANSPATSSPIGAVNNGEVEDYWWEWGPTAVKLLSFAAEPQVRSIVLSWETASELDNVGFHLYRRPAGTEAYTQLNAALISSQAPGQGVGARYTFVDDQVRPGVRYEYLLEDIDVDGTRTPHGPVTATAPYIYWLLLICK